MVAKQQWQTASKCLNDQQGARVRGGLPMQVGGFDAVRNGMRGFFQHGKAMFTHIHGRPRSEKGKQVIKVKRVYEPHESSDGPRFLVERLWPRGMKKESLHMEAWLKDAAPSDSLRRWFGHDPAKWKEFQGLYFAELDAGRETLKPLIEAAGKGDVTLLYSAHDTVHNNAIALKEYLSKLLRTGS